MRSKPDIPLPKHLHQNWPRSPIKTPFAISFIAADEILLVTLRFRAGADRDAIECCMFQIVDTFAVVEGLSQKEMQDLFWEQKRLSRTEHCITLRRRFSDPDYPQGLDYVREGRYVIVLRTFSKAYGLAGHRIGFGAMRPDLAGWLERTRGS